MCWFPFGNSSKRRNKQKTREKRNEKQAYDSRHSNRLATAKPTQETPRPKIRVEVPDRWYRTVEAETSSAEMLLNPKPERARQNRQRHPRRSSTTTLRGRGAKRDPPSDRKSSNQSKMRSGRGIKRQEWMCIPTPPVTPPQQQHHYQHQSQSQPQQNQHYQYQSQHQSQHQHQHQQQHQSQHRYQQQSHSQSHHQSHHQSQHQHHHHRPRQARQRPPNSAARRVPDRRFAVLAATNQALEDIRREAFTSSPAPRRVWRYQGVAVETAEIPFHWDCVSNQSSTTRPARHTATRHHRSRR
ncbi:hypothetical protein AOQ84DRAFT_218594 [Glonium stellatum]|uniref:Uncharacterized protein n=1 Tax=Glonium stellatum TaxID=574774 RepID=A0A8E2F4E4_9PEZI|nr:hypothetical protein AOQ84DRAFT_218594 [Glonium stellatum]